MPYNERRFTDGVDFSLCFAAYTNRDGETGIGTPWEVQYQDKYTVITKGGNLRGYSAVFSIVPDLQLGIHIKAVYRFSYYSTALQKSTSGSRCTSIYW